MTIAVIFNGQGAHYQGMGMDFIEQFPQAEEVITCASQASGDDVKALLNEDFSKLSQTRYAQIATAATSMAVFRSIEPQIPAIDYMAGLSLGEYSALMASGMLSMEDGFRLLKERGNLMSDHCEQLKKDEDIVMEAVLKVPLEDIEQLVNQVNQEETNLYIANLNSSTQTVIGGTQSAVDQFKKLGKEKGIRKTMPLSVEGPFHTPFMAVVCQPFKAVLDQVEFVEAAIPVISNTDVQPHQIDHIRETLTRHLVEPVRWKNTIDYFVDQGVDKIIQIGPGKTLGNLLKREKNVPDYAVVDSVDDIQALEIFVGG